ncbi:hypothetical protein ACI7BZ_11095 [Xanthobacter sp. AM11]|uniref:hypothetical protein n=1 Tax=Xanthobacter sp. AM11 TaxID=3380643 RepID=UPI0039BF93A4
MTGTSDEGGIAQVALERWNTLEEGVPLALALTRADIDNLLLGLRNLAIGQNRLVAALSAHSNQDFNGCMEAMKLSNELTVASFDRINAFITAVMAGATPVCGPRG